MQDEARPTVLLITIDSLRADHVGWAGYHRETTPVLDSLAESSHTFSNAYSHANQTPNSFPAILSSTYSTMYGGGKRLSEKQTLLSELLSEVGYTTAGFHSNPYLSEEFGYNRGYDTYYDSITDDSLASKARQFVKRNLDSEGAVFRLLSKAFDTTKRTVGVEIGSASVDAATITDMAVDWVQTSPKPPVFLWVHYMDVHQPYVPPPEHQLPFRDSPISERDSIKLCQKMLGEPEAITDEERAKLVDLYDAEIRFADAEIGRLIDAVDAELDDVVTVVTSDHGEELGEDGNYSHHIPKFFDEYTHVPLLIDDGTDGAVHDELVGLVDVPPTIADYGGARVPPNYVGSSLRRLIRGEPWERTNVIAEWQTGDGSGRNFAYRDEEWLYVYREPGAHHPLHAEPESEELYRVGDVGYRNRIDDEPETGEALAAVIDEHIEFVDSTGGAAVDVEMGEEVRQRLRDLGYQE
jgi:arylsulfatase A-like enzyme